MNSMKNNEQKFFRVVAKCGHVGRKQYIPVSFAVMASNGQEAAKKVRNFPRVKHHHKDAILQCEQIEHQQYLIIKHMNDNDPYLKCKNKLDQKENCHLLSRLVAETNDYVNEDKRENRVDRIRYKMHKYMTKMKEEYEDYEYMY